MQITIRRYKVDSPKEVTRVVNEVFSPFEQGRGVCCLPWNRSRPGIKTMKATAATQYSLDIPKATSVAGNPLLGTWKLQSLVFEAIETGQRSSPFGDHPVGYLGYSPDGWMSAIGVVEDRPKPRDLIPSEEEKAKLQETVFAYGGTYAAVTPTSLKDIFTPIWSEP